MKNPSTALVIGKTKSDAENMVKNLGLIGYKEILTRGEKSVNTLDGIRVNAVYIYEDCGDYAKDYARYIVAPLIDGNLWIIKRQ